MVVCENLPIKKNLETESSFPKHYADRKINKESAARCSQPCRRPSFKPLRFPCPGPASAHPPHPPNGPSRSASGSSRPARLQLSLLSSPARALLALHPPRPHSTVTPPLRACSPLASYSWTLLSHPQRCAPCQFSRNPRAEPRKPADKASTSEDWK